MLKPRAVSRSRAQSGAGSGGQSCVGVQQRERLAGAVRKEDVPAVRVKPLLYPGSTDTDHEVQDVAPMWR